MRLARHKLVEGPNGPCRIVYLTDDGKAVIRRINLNCTGGVSGTEFVPVKLLKEVRK